LTKASTNYTWDYDDRLVGISGSSVSAAYVYGFQGDRIKKTVSGVETGYFYYAEDIVKETTGGQVTDYLHGTGIDEPIMMARAGAKSFYFRDGLGSIREITDGMGTVEDSYAYGAWGELRVQNVTVPNSYGYTGREFSEDGLYFFRARYMDPGVGRFLSEDKIKLFLRMKHYAYCLNSPIEFRDPMGLDCKIEWHRGKDILVGTPWIEREFDGYYEAKFWCSLYMGIVIMYNWFYLGDEPYPDFCKYKITNYLVAWFQPTNDYYNVCRDKCGKVTKRELIYNGKWGKPYKATLDWWEEWAYVLN
jgi:RHS repeat-associated protein